MKFLLLFQDLMKLDYLQANLDLLYFPQDIFLQPELLYQLG